MSFCEGFRGWGGRLLAGAPVGPSYDAAVRYYTFEVVIEREEEDEGYLAYSPTPPGCFSNGKTIEDARRNIRETIQQHLAALLEHGRAIPQNEKLVHVEEPTLGIP